MLKNWNIDRMNTCMLKQFQFVRLFTLHWCLVRVYMWLSSVQDTIVVSLIQHTAVLCDFPATRAENHSHHTEEITRLSRLWLNVACSHSMLLLEFFFTSVQLMLFLVTTQMLNINQYFLNLSDQIAVKRFYPTVYQ